MVSEQWCEISFECGVNLMVSELTIRKLSNQGPSASRMFCAKTNKIYAEIWNLSTESGRQRYKRKKKEKLVRLYYPQLEDNEKNLNLEMQKHHPFTPLTVECIRISRYWAFRKF